MGGTTERAFLTSLLSLDGDEEAAETITIALRALMVLTRARSGRAEIQVSGEPQPMVLVTLNAPSIRTATMSPAASGGDVASNVFETGFATARLELHSRQPGVELTFRERELFELLFQAMARLTQRARGDSVHTTLHEATRAFQAKLVANALQRAHGNVARAARELRVTRAFVYTFVRAGNARRA